MGALIFILVLLGVVYFSANSISSNGSSRNSPAPAPGPAPAFSKQEEEFMMLCASGTAEEIQSALASLKNANDKTVLLIALTMAATNNGDERVLSVLINAGADVKAKGKDGQSILHYAVKNSKQNPKILDGLISAGSDVNARDNEGETPLMIAAMAPFDNSMTIKALLNAGADVEATHILNDTKAPSTHSPLIYAISSGNAQNVKAIIEAGADVNKQMKGKFFENGRVFDVYSYPLDDAVFGGNIEILKLLINAGAYVNASNSWGNTPLHTAQMNGKIEAARILEARGATL